MGLDISHASLEGERKRIHEILDSEDGYYWFFRLDGKMVGNASLHSLGEDRNKYGVKAATYTIMVGDRFAMGKGIGTAVTRAVFDWAFGEGFELIVARVAEPNAPSRALMQKLGMRHTGIVPNETGQPADLKEWLVYELNRGEWRG
jgi:RimJ/RimL family protein N-acetyltransferase